MKQLSQFIRILHIQFVFIRHGLDQIVLSIPWFAPVRFAAYLNPWNWYRKNDQTRGERIRLALEELGPIFVKFGQMLSTRRDLLPDDIADELAKLQDQVPPFPSDIAVAIVEAAYSSKLHDIFKNFDYIPLASASIAQVHTAEMLDGREVVVKIVRPDIKKVIRKDIDLLYTFARLLERYWADGRRLHPCEVVREFEHTIFDELDLMREAANASQLRRNFSNSPLLYVPEVFWSLTRTNVMVMERIEGIPISNIALLKERQIDLKKLAETGVEIFFTQVFRDCFFHADMHPGNIFVSPHKPNRPQYLGVDFGIMGTLSPKDQRYLAENFLAFFQRDYRKVAILHVDSGWVPANTRVDEFESAIRAVCEPVFERPLKDISFAQMLLRLFQTARRFNMEVQPQLMLLQKTLFQIEGLGRQLYPELDLWSTAKPYLENWIKQQMGMNAFMRKTRENMPYWLEKLPEVPELLFEILTSVREKQVIQPVSVLPLMELRKAKRHGFLWGVAISVVMLGAVLTLKNYF